MKISILRKFRLGIFTLALAFIVTLSTAPSNLDAARNGNSNGANNTPPADDGDTGDTGSGDSGSDDSGSDDSGSDDSGSDDSGSDDTGSGDTASTSNGNGNGNANGANNTATADDGTSSSDDTGSDDTGSDDTGSGETASTSSGNGNGNANGANNTTASDDGTTGGTQLGRVNGSMTFYYEAIDYSLPNDFDIVGPVTMIFDGDFNIGNNTVTVTDTGSLIIYAAGNITVNGNGGINNTGVPSKLIIIGTHPELADSDSSQHSITLSGNGFLSAAVYAPDAEYRSNGGGSGGATLGSVIAKEVRFNGSPGPFHYDEALGDLDLGVSTYSLSSYKLLKNGTQTPSSSLKSILGDSATTYKAVFDSVFASKSEEAQ